MKLDRSDSMILTTQSKWKGKGRYSNNGNEDIQIMEMKIF